ncbi:aldehyde dehydrogenase family protein [Bradyrhizobium yuanmingense]|uniref:aldehyde dehydrogenase family protein n=1 Tax=Bradyrhizobium yuanmingense TaxID=108015 RepID=UPI0023B94001|nr:aldehyde dehydrogenase family protein [Bradyrhizobium yuanmingense]MDF0498964.1 aldehyde dehydrogenase family protein [Bradyrhizobium yuanmingense]
MHGMFCERRYQPVPGGEFFPPMIVTEQALDSDFARSEIFGPVMALRPFDTDEEAWQLANETEYGLAAGSRHFIVPNGAPLARKRHFLDKTCTYPLCWLLRLEA